MNTNKTFFSKRFVHSRICFYFNHRIICVVCVLHFIAHSLWNQKYDVFNNAFFVFRWTFQFYSIFANWKRFISCVCPLKDDSMYLHCIFTNCIISTVFDFVLYNGEEISQIQQNKTHQFSPIFIPICIDLRYRYWRSKEFKHLISWLTSFEIGNNVLYWTVDMMRGMATCVSYELNIVAIFIAH